MSWFSLLFLSLSWMGVSKVYGGGAGGALCALAGVVLAVAAFRPLGRQGARLRPADSARRAGRGAAQCVLVLLAQGFVFLFAFWFFSRRHAEGFFAAISGRLLALFGLPAAVDGEMIYLGSAFKTIAFSSTWEKTGAICFVLLLAGAFVLLALRGARAKQYILLSLFSLAYALLRYTLLLLLYASLQFHSLFWSQAVSVATLLPYALLSALLFRRLPLPDPLSLLRIKRDKRSLVAATLAFALFFSAAAFMGFSDAGREKEGRVLVEEYHSNWEWTTEAYDENWFGERSGYNYYCFYEYIDKFYQVSRNTAPISREALADTDVLILKTPTEPYSDDEAEAIEAFVSEGGGLYMIGDHTNVFGTGSNLNRVAAAFGISFNSDCTYELSAGSLSEYDAPLLLPHPVAAGLPRFLFATSCTLDTPWLAQEIMTGYGLKNLPADYSQDNFFPADTDSGLVEFGAFVQCASAAYGKGRVIAFTDSTVYSNFWMHMPGKPELLLKSLQWLNRENVLPFAPRAAAAVALALSLIALAVFAGRLVRGGRSFPAGAFLVTGAAAFAFAAALFGAQAHSLKLPAPIKPIANICFEEEYSSALLPKDLEGFLADADRQISTFYVFTQRLGCVPSLQKSLSAALDKGGVTVLVKPDKPLHDIDGIVRKIEAGATLLLLENASGIGAADALLARAGMAVSAADTAGSADFGELAGIELSADAAAVTGGTPLMTDAFGNAILSVKRMGEGKIAVFSDPDLFFNARLGEVSSNLTERTRLLTRLEFQMMKALLEQGI
jgi:hypothetical protein